MPFGLLNVGATFQRAMDFSFNELMGKIIEIYQDELTSFSKERSDHIGHLRQVFERCRKYGISLNPTKSILGVDEGKLLGHIVAKVGVNIDPERVEAIKKVPLPPTKKYLQSFLGQINFVRRFIPNLAESNLVFQNSQSRPAFSLELQKLEQHQWYVDIIFFLSNLTCPSHLIVYKRRALRLKTTKYCIIQDGLGWRNPDGVILRCVGEIESKILLVDFHSGFCGGNSATKTTTHKIIRAGYYWPTIFSDVHKMVRGCQQCHLFIGKQKLEACLFNQ
jgi:hypothetical protein